MANYQPNYIYSPLYGNRYMGGSRTPAPSTGGAGQVDTSAIQSRNTAVGVPYTPVAQEEQPLGPIGFSSTGRDQSAVESLSPFGFRDISGITTDPFAGTDYLTTGFGSPSPINTTYVQSVPEPVATPTVSFGGDGGDSSSYTSSTGQGIHGPSSSSGEFSLTNPMDVAWGLYNFGSDLPDWAKPFAPGVSALNWVGGQMLDQQIDAIDKSFGMLDTPEGMLAKTDQYGNVSYVYDPNVESIGSQSNLNANQFAQLQSSLPEGASIQGVDVTGNVNVTMPDGSTARAGVSPNTGQVNTYNFNVNDTATFSSKDFSDDSDGDWSNQEQQTENTSTGAYGEKGVGSQPSSMSSAPQTNEELDADSADSGTSGGK